MTFIVRHTPQGPYFASLDDFNLSSDLSIERRAQISGVFKYGSGLLVPEEMPREVRATRKTYRDEFISNSGVRIISEAFRDLLEEMDAGRHQILPITLKYRSRTETRFILNVHVSQNTVIDSLSDVEKHPNADIMYFKSLPWGTGPINVSIDKNALGPYHVWREVRYPSSLLLSDHLHAEIMHRRLRVFQLRKAIDV